MAQTGIDICNRALLRVGANRIAALDDGSAEGRACADEYDALVVERLSVYPWRFAADLRALARRSETPPGGRWSFTWQVPLDVLAIRGVSLYGRAIDYDRFGDMIVANHAEDLVADVIVRVPEARWPGYFTGALVNDLAAVLALSLDRDATLARELEGKSGRLWAQARNRDSQQQSARRLPVGRLVHARL